MGVKQFNWVEVLVNYINKIVSLREKGKSHDRRLGVHVKMDPEWIMHVQWSAESSERCDYMYSS